MEIIYISVQIVMYTMIVYWMCWFQRDAGVCLLMCCALSVLHKFCMTSGLVAQAATRATLMLAVVKMIASVTCQCVLHPAHTICAVWLTKPYAVVQAGILKCNSKRSTAATNPQPGLTLPNMLIC